MFVVILLSENEREEEVEEEGGKDEIRLHRVSTSSELILMYSFV